MNRITINIGNDAIDACIAAASSESSREPRVHHIDMAAVFGAPEPRAGEDPLEAVFNALRQNLAESNAEEPRAERSETPLVSTANLRDTINGFLADTSKYVWRSKAAIVKYLGQVYSDMPPHVLEELLNSLWPQMEADGDIESRFAPVSGKEQFRAA